MAGIELSDAIRRGVDFLASAQQADGGFDNLFWYADQDPVAVANVFPAALIAHCLGFAPDGAAVREAALDFLEGEAAPEGVWGHWASRGAGEFLPPDVDDTACASAALRDGGRTPPDNRGLLLANRNRGGLYYTWFTWRPGWSNWPHLRLILQQRRHLRTLWLLFTRTSASIYDVDAVVNANVLFCLGTDTDTDTDTDTGAAPVVRYLVEVLKADTEERCDAYYFNRFVVWYFLARALGPWHDEACSLLRRKLASALPRTLLELATAQCARFYCGMPACPGISAALREAQLPSGAWPAEYLYRGKDCYWGSEALTTGFALEALAREKAGVVGEPQPPER